MRLLTNKALVTLVLPSSMKERLYAVWIYCTRSDTYRFSEKCGSPARSMELVKIRNMNWFLWMQNWVYQRVIFPIYSKTGLKSYAYRILTSNPVRLSKIFWELVNRYTVWNT